MLALPPLASEQLFSISGFPIFNTYINSSIVVLGFIVLGFFISRASKNLSAPQNAPTGIINFFESLLEILLGYADQVTHSRAKSIKFLPLVGSLFLFILASNWLGLLPGIGSIGVYQLHNGTVELIPLFRPANTDLNMTLAMAVFGVTATHFLGITAVGFFKYANKFIKLGDVWHGFKSLDPIKIFVAIVEFMVGIIEVFSEVAKMVSLSLRLFGNVFAGEVLLTVIASIIAYFIPVPFLGLELLVGLIQAVVFSMLILVYLTIATTEIHQHHDSGPQEQDLEATPTF